MNFAVIPVLMSITITSRIRIKIMIMSKSKNTSRSKIMISPIRESGQAYAR